MVLQFKQKTKQGGQDFKPSYNDRAHVTYAEASRFADSLKITRKRIAVLRTATEGAHPRLRQGQDLLAVWDLFAAPASRLPWWLLTSQLLQAHSLYLLA